MFRRTDISLKLATWNIHSGIGGDGYLDMERIVSVLAEIDADVVGLQEVGWHRRTHHRIDQFAYLREHTGYTVIEGLVRDPLRAQFGNALLTRLPLEKTRWIDLKIVGHVPRAALVAEVDGGASLVQVTVLHLGLTVWERERQIRRLMEALSRENAAQREEVQKEGARKDRAADDIPPPAVLLGDFNMLRRRTRASAILGQRFPNCVRMPTYPARRPQLSLDRIYLSPQWEVVGASVFDHSAALQASDHLPLVAEVRTVD
jgi:endonuclease/exonuclease/phosphatase family metal-dependent hydrolase